jgi:hypothetical protein
VEGVKSQLERDWQRRKCSDLELSDLKDISFRKCLANEIPSVDKCFPAEKWAELNEALGEQATKNYDPSSLIDAITDAIPIADDPWGPRIGD